MFLSPNLSAKEVTAVTTRGHRGSPGYWSPTHSSYSGRQQHPKPAFPSVVEGTGTQTVLQSMYLNPDLISHGRQCFTPEKNLFCSCPTERERNKDFVHSAELPSSQAISGGAGLGTKTKHSSIIPDFWAYPYTCRERARTLLETCCRARQEPEGTTSQRGSFSIIHLEALENAICTI